MARAKKTPGHGGVRENQTGRPPVLREPVTVTAQIEREHRNRVAELAKRRCVSFAGELRRLLAAALQREG